MNDHACRPLESNEVSLVLTQLKNDRDRTLFVLGLRSGFRISELLSLTLEDVFRNGQIVDRVRVHSSHMKGKTSFREVKLHSEAKIAIQALIERGIDPKFRPTAYLFESQKGNRLSRCQAWRILTRAFDEAGLEGKLACHSMRKSFAVNIYNASGFDIVKTRDLLGHKDIGTTNDYLASNRKDLDDIIDKI